MVKEEKKSSMTVEEAGHKGGQKERELVRKGEEEERKEPMGRKK